MVSHHECVTLIFLFIIMGATHCKSPAGFAGRAPSAWRGD